MGKPFKKEIEESISTIKWAIEQDVVSIQKRIFKDMLKPLFIVGSGGSLSACHFVAHLYQNMGYIAKAITPLELYYIRYALKNSKILFISSSGKNNDILFAFKIALENYPSEITTICMRKNTPLTNLANSYSISKGFEYDIPTKKDGFLATNSLTAFFAILAKSTSFFNIHDLNFEVSLNLKKNINDFVNKLSENCAITILYAGWATPIAYDIESKFTEAALGSISIADYRNFGHGRHHWFDKRKNNSAIISLITPEEMHIAVKTLNLIPSDIPRLILKSDKEFANSSIELLIQSYHVVNTVGELLKIDPGRPGVPEFGSKLFHLKYSSLYKKTSIDKSLNPSEVCSILKKTGVSSIKQLSTNELIFWRKKYFDFYNSIINTKFSSIVLDYDGTLCSPDARYIGRLSDKMSYELNRLLEAGIIVGIATGRGQSVKTDLRNSNISVNYWKNIIIGYYNGSDIGTLDDDSCPNTNIENNQQLLLIENQLKKINLPDLNLNIKLRPNQLTIQITDSSNWNNIKKIIQNLVMLKSNGDLQLLESSHSIDVVVKNKVSKNKVVNKCIEMTGNLNCLCIGDKGQWPGNDYELLSSPYSLSVDEVSAHPDSCWNIVSLGLKNFEATQEYFNRIIIKDGCFIFR